MFNFLVHEQPNRTTAINDDYVIDFCLSASKNTNLPLNIATSIMVDADSMRTDVVRYYLDQPATTHVKVWEF